MTHRFQHFCLVVGADPDDENVHLWYAAAIAMDSAHDLGLLCRGFQWNQHSETMSNLPKTEWSDEIMAQGIAHPAMVGTLEHLLVSTRVEDASEFLGEVLWRTMALESLNVERLDELATAMICSTTTLIAALECLRTVNEVSEAVLETFPELHALRTNPGTSIEHERSDTRQPLPLLEHLVDRCFARKLLGLERGDISRFQYDNALTEAAFSAEVAIVNRLTEHRLMPPVRAALLFLDFTKGGSLAQRERWLALGADPTVHNEASAWVLRQSDTLRRCPRMRANPLLAETVLQLIRVHGTVGQSIRGESPLTVFSGFIDFLRQHRAKLAVVLAAKEHEAVDLVVDMLHVINICDTAAVREGLLTDELRFEMVALENLLRRMGKETSTSASSLDLNQFDLSAEDASDVEELHLVRCQWLWDRLSRLRRSRIAEGEPSEATVRVVRKIDRHALKVFSQDLSTCQLWYCEIATAGLSPESQLKILALAVKAGRDSELVSQSTHYDVSFEQMVEMLEQRSGSPANRYRLRLLETILRPLDLDEICSGTVGVAETRHILGSIEVKIGGRSAIGMRFETSDEAEALITLLIMYEKRSAAAFHATLKSLCDLYGLRKDDFDRLSNEANYLATMNAARSDKERMLDHVLAGRIVEIGPGGGVILDLLEDRFPKSDILGVDLSAAVVEALNTRKKQDQRQWKVLEADAFDLPEHIAPQTVDTVVLCSVLHEIFSYVERPVAGSAPQRFRLESVRDLLRSCYAVLKPGGRIVIRDGVMPPDEPRLIEFLEDDGREFFELFQAQFEGRKIHGEWVSQNVVRLSAPDAMEFLYCYTWGPASFPYEVREQYGVLPYGEYCESIVAWLSSDVVPEVVELAPELQSYLQPGYPEALDAKIVLRDALGVPVNLPDSNCLIVIQKPIQQGVPEGV